MSGCNRSIIQRLDPENVCKVQYLHRDTALFAEDEWTWTHERAGAHVFETHAAAETFAREAPYEIVVGPAKGRVHTFPHAVVLGSPDVDEARERRHEDKLDAMEASARKVIPTPTEVFQNLERRKLA